MKMPSKKESNTLSTEDYEIIFGLGEDTGEYEKQKLHKSAWEKAWEIRNFEIDKFWTRTAFFWGFVALIFGAYVTVVTGKHSQTVKDMYLDLLLILLGCIFSVAWLLVILGSKRWQENWEAHIEKLEDNITGPLYKTIYYNPKKRFYSVTKINVILAKVVIVTWILLFVQYIADKYDFLQAVLALLRNHFFIVAPIALTVFCIFVLVKSGRSAFDKSRGKLDGNVEGKFIYHKTTLL
jgi:hypothetical protein